MIVYEHDKPGLGEGPRETFEPMFLHASIAMRHGDGGMRTRPCLRHEQPTTKMIATLALEFPLAPLDHHVLRGEAITVAISVHPGRRATAGYCRPCLDRSERRGRARRSRYAVSPAGSPGCETDDRAAAAPGRRRRPRPRRSGCLAEPRADQPRPRSVRATCSRGAPWAS